LENNNSILLTKGTELNPYYVQRLKDYGYNYVFINDEFTEDIQPTELIGQELRLQANSIVFSLLTENSLLDSDEKIKELRDVAREIVSEIVAEKKPGQFNLLEIKTYDNYVYLHSVNVAALGVLLAKELGMNYKEMEDYAIGALLHDIGKIQVPVAIIAKDGPLNEEEFKAIQVHTRLGFKMLLNNSYLKPRSFAISLYHHEAYNGSGYPLGLKGKDIHIFSRIAKVCDIFDALISERSYKKRWSFSDALEHMTKNSKQFDPELLQLFIQRIPPYPVGSIVQLATGETGVVVANSTYNLKKPRLRIITNRKGEKLSKSAIFEVRMELNPDIKIVSALS
jgi:putative nucleotidyltransferase with HDIG domain